MSLLQRKTWSGGTKSSFNNSLKYLRRITQPRITSGLAVNVLAGDVVTNSLLVVITASAPNCWQNKSRDEAVLLLNENIDVNRLVQAKGFSKQRIV